MLFRLAKLVHKSDFKNLPQYMKSLLWTSFATYKLNTISGITAPYKEVKNVYGLH